MTPELWTLFGLIVGGILSGGIVTGVMRERNRNREIEHQADHQDRVDVATEWARIDARNQLQWETAMEELEKCRAREGRMAERVAVAEDRAERATARAHAAEGRAERTEIACDNLAMELAAMKRAMAEAIEGTPIRGTWTRDGT